jgi:ribonuclease Y
MEKRMTMEFGTVAGLSVLAIGAGAIVALAYARYLARRYANLLVPTDLSTQVLQNANWRKETALQTARETTRQHLETEGKRLDDEREVVLHLQKQYEKDLDQRQSALDKRNNELNKYDERCAEIVQNIESTKQKILDIEAQKREVQEQFEQSLEAKAGVVRDELRESIKKEILSSEQLSISKWQVENFEDIKLDVQRFAKLTLNSVVHRYNPKFIWPKTAFSVETPSKALAEQHFSRDGKIIPSLVEGLGIEVDLLASGDEAPTIKIAGGSGVEKEALRLTFEEMIARGEFTLDKAIEIREKFRKQLDKLTLKFGDEAAKALGLSNMHPEILKLIGSLNYRTSHRQNQYYHSLEVGRLAGMLAEELGIDPVLARRSGLLHDIGKALDYRIEGSHAVISADYAERFDETREVIDTVLSHHDDKILETPHAYVLKAADALSGARPGARVEMEEGYQKRIESIAAVVDSFEKSGVNSTVIMNAGREVHVFVDSRRVKEKDVDPLALAIVKKLESDVEFPGQIRVTVVRRTEVTEVA